MGTNISVRVVGMGKAPARARHWEEAIGRVVECFGQVEALLTPVGASSGYVRLEAPAGQPNPVSPLLFDAVELALGVAAASAGAFDPVVPVGSIGSGGLHAGSGGVQVAERMGAGDGRPATCSASGGARDRVDHRDVALDREKHSITLARPLALDLGALAKGLAIDLAARELRGLGGFIIDAGGDLYMGGRTAAGEPWTVGIRHPREKERLIDAVRVSDMAVCTSGDYEGRNVRARRRGAPGGGLVDRRSGLAATRLASVTVVARSAMVADALGTAAFILGPEEGVAFLERQGVQGLLLTPSLERFVTRAGAGRPAFPRTLAGRL